MKWITQECLESLGFKRDKLLGYSLKLSEGPDDTELSLSFGTYPHNEFCFCLAVGGFGVVVDIGSKEDLEALIRMTKDAPIDHPDIMEIDDETFVYGDDE